MQPIKVLNSWLEQNAGGEHYLFTLQDLRALFPDLSDGAFKTLLSRAAGTGHFIRVCRGIYAYKKNIQTRGYLLFHIAALLRSHKFNYISLETALSEAGVISQIPINWISIMSSGRSTVVHCDEIGTIEFIHTNQKPTDIMEQLSYDPLCRMWRASVPLALRDMKATHRNCDLIDWDTANEFIR